MMIGRKFPTPPSDGLPPEQVRILDLKAQPWPDGRRVRIFMTLTPFLERPDIDVAINGNTLRNEACALTIVENIDDTLNFTMHIKIPDPEQAYTLFSAIRYAEQGIVDQQSVTFFASGESSTPESDKV